MHPPAPPACLTRPYNARPGQRGGTLIAETVHSLHAHAARLCDPDGYRPPWCGHCDCNNLHAHDFRQRLLRGDDEPRSIDMRRYRCAGCGAVWLVLPALIARHLHTSWRFVLGTMVTLRVLLKGSRRRRSVPATTAQRWTRRMASAASKLSQVLAAGGTDVAAEVLRLGHDGTRASFIEALALAGRLSDGLELAELGAWVHRLLPGVRVM